MPRPSDNATGTRAAWIVVLVYFLLLTSLLLSPHALWLLGDSGQEIENAVDRTISGFIQHAVAYGLLGCLLVWALRGASGSRQLAWAALAIGHGVAAEGLQWFVPLRYCDWVDGLANVLGVGLGWLAASLILRAADKTVGESVA